MKEHPEYVNYVCHVDGRIFSKNRDKFLSSNKTWCGYLRVNVYKDGIRKKYSVHRMIAEALIDNPDKLPVVNHKNGNKQDNRVENLEWTTQKENIRHAFATGLHSRPKGKPYIKKGPKKFCIRGHEFNEQNTKPRIGRNGKPWRICQLCVKERSKQVCRNSSMKQHITKQT